MHHDARIRVPVLRRYRRLQAATADLDKNTEPARTCAAISRCDCRPGLFRELRPLRVSRSPFLATRASLSLLEARGVNCSRLHGGLTPTMQGFGQHEPLVRLDLHCAPGQNHLIARRATGQAGRYDASTSGTPVDCGDSQTLEGSERPQISFRGPGNGAKKCIFQALRVKGFSLRFRKSGKERGFRARGSGFSGSGRSGRFSGPVPIQRSPTVVQFLHGRPGRVMKPCRRPGPFNSHAFQGSNST
jgi:hypothetical protein